MKVCHTVASHILQQRDDGRRWTSSENLLGGNIFYDSSDDVLKSEVDRVTLQVQPPCRHSLEPPSYSHRHTDGTSLADINVLGLSLWSVQGKKVVSLKPIILCILASNSWGETT
jgi:hypothetical protein